MTTNQIILLVIVIVLAVLYVIYLIKRYGFKKVALQAILFAEKQYNTTSGKERMNIAIDFVYDNYIPEYIKSILSKETLHNILDKAIQKVFNESKQLLDYQRAEIKSQVLDMKSELKEQIKKELKEEN